MARKNTPSKNLSPKPTPKVATKNVAVEQSSWQLPAVLSRQSQIFIIGSIILITFLCYSRALNNEFTNWDDDAYVTKNPLVKDLSAANFQKIINPSTAVGLNYHPITVLSLALNYKMSGMNPSSYIFTNILFHLLSTILVFVFCYRLSDRQFWLAAVASLWFGIHPMHVESVAWISERKDVLYVFFLLLGLVTYQSYLAKEKYLYLGLTFVCFMAACLSKAMATPFPILLLLVDFYRQRPLKNAKIWLEKIPFFLFAAWVGYNAIMLQKESAINEVSINTLGQRFIFASYGLWMYVVKWFFPHNFTTFYPYPLMDSTHQFPAIYYLSPVFALLILAVPLWLAYRKSGKDFRVLVFGLGFFLASVALVLQIVAVGMAVMADRYSYLPSIGLLFISAYFLNEFAKKSPKLVVSGVILYSFLLGIMTFQQLGIWKTSETLWSDVIKKYPNQYYLPYFARGRYYADKNDDDAAYNDFQQMIALIDQTGVVASKQALSLAYNVYGSICGKRKEFDKAIKYLNQSIENDPKLTAAYLNRAITFASMGQLEKAAPDFEKAYSLEPKEEDIQKNRASFLKESKQFEQSIVAYNQLLNNFKPQAEYYFSRGFCKFSLKNYTDALKDFNEAVRLKPDYGDAFYDISVCYYFLKDNTKALAAAKQAAAVGYVLPENYVGLLTEK